MKEIIFLIIISTTFTYLVFPLIKESREITSSDNQTIIIKKLDEINFYVTINIGSEKKNVKAFITQANSDFCIGGQNTKNHKYDETSSESYNCTNTGKISLSYSSYEEGLLSTETFYIENEKKEIQEIKNVDFILGTRSKESNINEGEIGLHLPYNNASPELNFVFCLKRTKIINSYYWYFDFDDFSNGNGKMVVDGFPHDLNPKIYNESNKIEIKGLNRGYTVNWGFFFTNIYYDESYISISNEVEGQIEFNKGLISAPSDAAKNLEESFFNKYLEKDICFKIEKLTNEFFYYCKKDKKFDIKEFKSIYLKSADLEIIFELDYKDLFYYNNNYYIFLITFKGESNIWNLGELFYKKYYIFYNQDSKNIGYYKGMEQEKKKSKDKDKINYFLLIFILLFLILIGVIIVGIIFYLKKGPRKNRANELDDDNYSYEVNPNDSEDKINKLIDEKNNNNYIN